MRISCIAVVFPVVMWWELFVDNVPVYVSYAGHSKILQRSIAARYCSEVLQQDIAAKYCSEILQRSIKLCQNCEIFRMYDSCKNV